MNLKYFPFLLTVLIFSTPVFSQETIDIDSQINPPILPETTTQVALSNTDANRVICGTPITDVVYSQEKGLIIHFTKNDAYIKFQIIKEGPQLQYAFNPTEIFIVCNGNTYHLVAMPKRIPSQTLRLTNGAAKAIKENQSLFQGLPHEEKISRLFQLSYTDQLPNSFTVQSHQEKIDLFQDIIVTLIRSIEVEGEGYRIKEFVIQPKKVSAAVGLKEEDFLLDAITLRPVAISIDVKSLKSGEAARMIIIERRGSESNG